MEKIRVGDRVRLQKSSIWSKGMEKYEGQIVTITEINGGDYKFDGSDSWAFDESSFKKIDTDFKVGDLVKIHKHFSWNSEGKMDHYDGQIVKLTKIDDCQGWFNGSDGWSFNIECFEKVHESKKEVKMEESDIKVGDMVEITKGFDCWNDSMDKFIGRKVKVTAIDPSRKTVKFDGDEGWYWHITRGHLKKCEDIQVKKKTEKFEPGDWITITHSNTNWNSSMDGWVGETVQITEVASSGNEIFFDSPGCDRWHWIYSDGHFRGATPSEIMAATRSKADTPKYKDGFKFTFCSTTGSFTTGSSGWFWNGSPYDYPFVVLGIDTSEKKYAYQKKILGYRTDHGCFPWCNTAEDLYKLCEALKKDIESGKSVSSYTIGDYFTFAGQRGILKSCGDEFYWDNESGYHNGYPFDLLGVKRYEYQKRILGYTNESGGFPFCRSFNDLVKLCESLKKDLETPGFTPRESERTFDGPTASIASEEALIAKTPSKSIYTSGTGRIKPVVIKVRKI